MIENLKSVRKIEIDNINSKISLMFEIIRNDTNLNHTDFSLILFLLSIHKEGYLKNVNENHSDINYYIFDCIQKSENHNQTHYLILFRSFENSLIRMSKQSISKILTMLRDINPKELFIVFSEVFDSVLDRISQSNPGYTENNSCPIEISRLMFSLGDVPKNANIYNPFAGLSSFGVISDESQLYIGQEINQITWCIGILRLLAYGKNVGNYTCEDSILNWPLDTKFDLIISNPPFNLRLGSQYINYLQDVSSFNTAEQFVIEKGFQSLKHDGKLVILMSQGVLYKTGLENRLREHLVQNDLIETIISLPSGLISNTGIPLVIMVLSNNKKNSGKVRFVDAEKFVIKKNSREKTLNDFDLINFLQSSINEKGIISLIENEKIKENEYILSVQRYLKPKIEGVKLGDLVDVIKGDRNHYSNKGKLLRIKDLKDSKFDYKLDLSLLDNVEDIKQDFHFISESCLFIALFFKTLKPTLFEYKDEAIFKRHDILAVKVKENKVDIAYLINELHADYVIEQLDSLRIGSSISSIRRTDLLNIVIHLPSPEEQKAKVEGAKQAHIQAKEETLKLEKQLLGVKEDTFREFASIKHSFRQYLGALMSNVAGTRKFLIKKDGQKLSLDDIYSNKLNQTFRDHLLSVEETIASLSKLLETDNFTSMGDNIETYNLVELVKIAHQRFEQDCFKFDFDFDKLSFNDDKLEPQIDINKEDFLKLFSNIVSNAINHGFKTKQGNVIFSLITFDKSNENCVLEISNNGIPMPERFTLKHLTTRGEKTTDSKGTGIGGADIKEIVAMYNGSLELINDVNSPFPVTYRISFPTSKKI